MTIEEDPFVYYESLSYQNEFSTFIWKGGDFECRENVREMYRGTSSLYIPKSESGVDSFVQKVKINIEMFFLNTIEQLFL